METIFTSEVNLVTHKVNDRYVEVVLKEEHDAKIDRLENILKLMVNKGLHALPDGTTVVLCDKYTYDIARIVLENGNDMKHTLEAFAVMEEYAKQKDAEIDALVEWVRYEMEEAGADDEKDEAHNADGTKLLEKHK